MMSNQQVINKPEKSKNNFSIIVREIVHLDNRDISDNLKNYNLTSQEIYSWILNNQNDLNAVVLLGEFNQLGIGIDVNNKKAFELYREAADLGHAVGTNNLGFCYQEGIGTDIDKEKAFE